MTNRDQQPRPAAAKRVLVWLVENEQSQRWLADKLGISESLVSNILNGRRPASEKVREGVLRLTGVDLHDNSTSSAGAAA